MARERLRWESATPQAEFVFNRLRHGFDLSVVDMVALVVLAASATTVVLLISHL